MSIRRATGEVRFASERSPSDNTPPASFRARYRPLTVPSPPSAGTLEHWLTERYCLYTLDDAGRVLRGDIHHRPWVLQEARVDIGLNTMTREIGVDVDESPLVHFAARQDAVFWSLAPASSAAASV